MFAQQLLNDIATDSGKKLLTAVVVAVVSGVASFLVGRYWGRYQAGRQWKKKEFLDRVIVSLNLFADGGLKIRTVLERSLDEVFLNRVAVDKVLAAARRCTADTPLLPIDPADRWYILNFVLNAVAEQFALGHIRRDAGQPVTVVRYALFLTAELVGDERIRKVRAMLVRADHLVEFPYPDALPALENPWHATRVATLRAAARVYATAPDQFLTLEVCV